MAILDPPVAERVLQRGRGDPRNPRPRQPPADDRAIAAVDDRRQVAPSILAAEDMRRIDRRAHIRPRDTRDPAPGARPLAPRPLPDLPAVGLENPMDSLAVDGRAELPPHQHGEPA